MLRHDYPDFEPHPWLRCPHRQTIAGAYLPGARFRYRAAQHEIALEDGDRLVLHDDRPANWQPGQRIALLLHGLGGSHRSNHVSRVAGRLHQRGIRTARLDFRGSGAGWRLALKPGHAGRSEDAAAAVRFLAEHCPGSPVTLIGFSMGGNVALKLAGQVGEEKLGGLDSVLASCPPIDTRACADNMKRPERQWYTRSYLWNLMRQIRARRRFTPALAALDLRQPPRQIDEFDDRVTAPLSGYADVDDYYRHASAAPLLAEVALPTVIIAARDDPIVPHEVFEQTELSPAIRLLSTDHGGHLGYIAPPSLDPDRRWLDWRIVEFVLERGVAHPPRDDW